MKLNNLYNFKNPVKHFLDIDNLNMPEDISSFDIKNLSWTEPFKFRVKKQEDKFRTLKMPNILNFVAAFEHFRDLSNFESVQSSDPLHKRLSANLDTGDFISGEYDRQLEEDFNRLCIYDHLLKLDIKEYYGRIYTHLIDFEGHNERFLSNMNLGKTNGLMMGNYLSLYFAEINLTNISNEIEKEINEAGIDCEFSYFSDDFYFFCNKGDVETVIKIFDKVLEKYELERNEDKKETWTYGTFNDYNLVARYWKKLIAHCNIRFNEEREDNKLYFINQLVFRLSKLEDDKLKKVFINNFFKTKYFRELNLEKYQVKNYDYHQLCFLLSVSPESMLYTTDKFSAMSRFDNDKIHKFFKVRFREVLQKPFNEEQLYFYYAIKILGFTDILREMKGLVLESNNQILISYYLKEGQFGEEEINFLKEKDDEQYWFQNYHLILYSEDLLTDLESSIEKYLIPKKASKEYQKRSYMDFYRENLLSENTIIRDIPDVLEEIKEYLALRIEESEAMFEAEEEEMDMD
ncbi:reverse transcriptase domain-containing protein [Heyndrickxia ginsengihumi]|uniref:reverse transcriptase domain-containing protein n=1 Tax=Heyndrickxia ginsengihumi TaxID=363870 RepID=UPI003D1EBB3F